ncbi:MAG: SDR family oxidoreductase [Hydrogenophaga sp.]|nr:SDR family oxidoreductase [Hydrogenophaga sp.]
MLVTGGAHRLGAQLVRCFAEAGWQVWCHHGKSGAAANALAEELNGKEFDVETVQADLSNQAQVVAMVSRIEAQAGPLRAIVNNASSFEPDSGVDFDPDLARAQLEVNLIAPLLLGRELARHRRENPLPDSCVLHVLDQKVHNLNPDYFSYTVSKLALERSVALQAQALAPAVRVCGVSPGLMYLSGPQEPGNFERAGRVNLLRRVTDPQDVARTCRFLAETTGITGTVVNVDNGQHLVPLPRDVMFVVDELLQSRLPA